MPELYLGDLPHALILREMPPEERDAILGAFRAAWNRTDPVLLPVLTDAPDPNGSPVLLAKAEAVADMMAEEVARLTAELERQAAALREARDGRQRAIRAYERLLDTATAAGTAFDWVGAPEVEWR